MDIFRRHFGEGLSEAEMHALSLAKEAEYRESARADANGMRLIDGAPEMFDMHRRARRAVRAGDGLGDAERGVLFERAGAEEVVCARAAWSTRRESSPASRTRVLHRGRAQAGRFARGLPDRRGHKDGHRGGASRGRGGASWRWTARFRARNSRPTRASSPSSTIFGTLNALYNRKKTPQAAGFVL